jgi:hypothetical protein
VRLRSPERVLGPEQDAFRVVDECERLPRRRVDPWRDLVEVRRAVHRSPL